MRNIRSLLLQVLVLMMLGGPALASTPKWQRAVRLPPMPVADQRGFAKVNGIAMYYAVYGKANRSPILLIHGGMGSSDVWSQEIPTLSVHHEVIVADSRWQGRSTHDRRDLSYHLMAEDYVALLDFLKVREPALVGWSDGGIIGLDIAINHPHLLSRLFAQAANKTPDGLTSIPHYDPDPIAKVPPAEGFADATIVSHQMRWQHVRQRIFDRLWATEPNFTDADLGRIRIPTEIVIGDHDGVIRPDQSQAIASAIPGARLVVLKDVGHAALIQDPDQYDRAVLDFVDGESTLARSGEAAQAVQAR